MKPEKLEREELWQRVRNLEGRTVATLKVGKANFVESVSEDRISITRRNSQPTRTQVNDVYDNVWEKGEFRLYGGNWRGQSQFIWAVVPAIVLAAVPDQLEKINDDGLSGIRLKKL